VDRWSARASRRVPINRPAVIGVPSRGGPANGGQPSGARSFVRRPWGLGGVADRGIRPCGPARRRFRDRLRRNNIGQHDRHRGSPGLDHASGSVAGSQVPERVC